MQNGGMGGINVDRILNGGIRRDWQNEAARVTINGSGSGAKDVRGGGKWFGSSKGRESRDCGRYRAGAVGRIRQPSSSRVQPGICPRLLAKYAALARSIDSLTSSLCHSFSFSLGHPVAGIVGEVKAEAGSVEGCAKFGDPKNGDFVGDV